MEGEITMLQFMLLMVVLDLIVKMPDYRTVYKLRKSGWTGTIRDYYEWKRK